MSLKFQDENVVRAVSGNDQVQYLLQMSQQHPQASVQQVTLNAQGQPIQLQSISFRSFVLFFGQHLKIFILFYNTRYYIQRAFVI